MKRLLQYTCLAIIAGVIIGFIISVLQISSNEYINYGAYNLILYYLQENINKYTLLIACASLVLILLKIGLARLRFFKGSPVSKLLNQRVLLSVLIALIIAYILQSYFSVHSIGIIKYLKSSPLNDLLAQLSSSKKETQKIYNSVIYISGILFIVLCSYVLLRFQVTETVLNGINKIAHSKITTYAGIALIAVLVIFNVYVITYKNSSTPDGPNVILISLDTTRADRLSSYGYSRNTSPNIDKLAAQGVLFENAYSQAPWTLPAMATVHTSLYPTEHGVIYGNVAIKGNLITLAEYLKNNNYKTMAITTHSFVDSNHGFSQGFDIFDELNHRGNDDISSERISQKAIELISDNKDDKFFLWVHYFDPHAAYINHEEYNYGQNPNGNYPDVLKAVPLNNDDYDLNPEFVQYVNDVYDEEVSFTDRSVGKVIDALSDMGLKEDTVIILTVDHGEELFDRTRFGHGNNTYEELIHVPLIIYDPSQKELAGTRIKHAVETRKIPKTIVEVCGIENSHFGGENLFEIAKGDKDSQSYFAFSEGSSTRSDGTIKHAIIGKNWKLIKNLGENSFELYDLENDPGEKINLIESEEPENVTMRNELYSELSGFKKERLVELEKVEFTKQELEELKALGYLQ